MFTVQYDNGICYRCEECTKHPKFSNQHIKTPTILNFLKIAEVNQKNF